MIPKEQNESRLDWIDSLRGMAALSVMVYHVVRDDIYWARIVNLGGWVNIGVIAVFVFFFVSGYVIRLTTFNKSNYKVFLKKRFIRLYPPYLIAIIATILLSMYGYCGSYCRQLVMTDLQSEPFKYVVGVFSIQLANFNIISPMEVDWTLSVESLFYVLYALTMATGLNRHMVFLFIPVLISSHYMDICRYLPFLVLGTVIHDFHKLKKPNLPVLILFVGALAFNYVSFQITSKESLFGIINVFVSISIFLIFMTFMQSHWLVSNPASLFLGKISYSLYLVHVPVYRILQHLNVPYYMLLSAVMSIVIASLFYYSVEKYFISLSKRFRQQPDAMRLNLNATKIIS